MGCPHLVFVTIDGRVVLTRFGKCRLQLLHDEFSQRREGKETEENLFGICDVVEDGGRGW